MDSIAGIRVLDLSRLLPGPYATQLLADLGAEVIKVERPPEGDYMRIIPPIIGLNGTSVSAYFAQVNRGKKSVSIDFSSPPGRAVLLRLVESADVFVESFRPGALNRRGLGYEALRDVNPRLVYCSLSGYGQNGPLKARAGHDINFVALAGILNLNSSRDRPPVPLPVQIADLAGGMLAAINILAALWERQRTGQGRYIDASLYDAAFEWMKAGIYPSFQRTREDPRRGEMELNGAFPCYNVYETSDGRYMSLGALEPNFWITFCRELGRPDLVDSQYDTDAIPTVASIFRTRTQSDWLEFAKQADVCLEPLLTVTEALAHPQAQTRGLAGTDGRPLPEMGQHTAQVLRTTGYAESEIQELARAGTITIV